VTPTSIPASVDTANSPERDDAGLSADNTQRDIRRTCYCNKCGEATYERILNFTQTVLEFAQGELPYDKLQAQRQKVKSPTALKDFAGLASWLPLEDHNAGVAWSSSSCARAW